MGEIKEYGLLPYVLILFQFLGNQSKLEGKLATFRELRGNTARDYECKSGWRPYRREINHNVSSQTLKFLAKDEFLLIH